MSLFTYYKPNRFFYLILFKFKAESKEICEPTKRFAFGSYDCRNYNKKLFALGPKKYMSSLFQDGILPR